MADTICIDFDGVLHSYTSGWKGAGTISDPPTPGAQEFVRALQASGWKVVIQSARAASVEGTVAITDWLRHWGFPHLEVVHGKPFAVLYLDDRGMRFNGSWPTLSDIEVAKVPWNRR